MVLEGRLGKGVILVGPRNHGVLNVLIQVRLGQVKDSHCLLRINITVCLLVWVIKSGLVKELQFLQIETTGPWLSFVIVQAES